jgi:fructose-specific PTS system IIB-like component
MNATVRMPHGWHWHIPGWLLRHWKNRVAGGDSPLKPGAAAKVIIFTEAYRRSRHYHSHCDRSPEDNERFETRDVYEITLQDAIKNAAGTLKEIEEMIAAEQ